MTDGKDMKSDEALALVGIRAALEVAEKQFVLAVTEKELPHYIDALRATQNTVQGINRRLEGIVLDAQAKMRVEYAKYKAEKHEAKKAEREREATQAQNEKEFSDPVAAPSCGAGKSLEINPLRSDASKSLDAELHAGQVCAEVLRELVNGPAAKVTERGNDT